MEHIINNNLIQKLIDSQKSDSKKESINGIKEFAIPIAKYIEENFPDFKVVIDNNVYYYYNCLESDDCNFISFSLGAETDSLKDLVNTGEKIQDFIESKLKNSIFYFSLSTIADPELTKLKV